MDDKSSSEMANALVNKYFQELDMKDLAKEYVYNKEFFQEYKKLMKC